MDEQGEMHFSTDFTFPDSVENPIKDIPENAETIDKQYKQLMRGLVKTIWGDHNYHVSKAIRVLSMGEMIACAEPYQNAEEFWYTMMFDFIPYYEKYANSLKKPYGYNPAGMIRPISGVFPNGFSICDMGKPMN